MANPMQQRSRMRKIIYAVAIVVLLTCSLGFRKLVVESQAYDLQLRREGQGEVDLSSSAIRHSLSGSRGLATCILWQIAIEKQKRHQWNELDLCVQSITILQPYFVTPWLFQSWNLAFNVSVEWDEPRDKYFFVSKGLRLLAKGESIHQGDIQKGGSILTGERKYPGNPNMRYYVGFFSKMKIGQSDEKNYMSCLFDMSLIDPKLRDPSKLDTEAGFKQFCLDHPRLVRRLHDKLGRTSRKDIQEFLRVNKNIPSRYDPNHEDSNEEITHVYDNRLSQFPVLPPLLLGGLPDPTAYELKDPKGTDVSVFTVTRAWYEFAQEPLPPYKYDLPTFNEEDKPADYEMKFREPKMMTIIFRGEPSRAQQYIAENLQEEGWFDGSGWETPPQWKLLKEKTVRSSVPVTLVFDGPPVAADLVSQLGCVQGASGFGAGAVSPMLAVPPGTLAHSLPGTRSETNTFIIRLSIGGEKKYHTAPAWEEAYKMYEKYGKDNLLLMSREKLQQIQHRNLMFMVEVSNTPFNYRMPKEERERTIKDEKTGSVEKLGDCFDAHEILQWQNLCFTTTNYMGHYQNCKVERLPDVVTVRKKLHHALELQEGTELIAALRELEGALLGKETDFSVPYENRTIVYGIEPNWRSLMLKHPAFAMLDSVQEKTLTLQMRYLREWQNYQIYGIGQGQGNALHDMCVGFAQMGLVNPVFGFSLPAVPRDKDGYEKKIIPIRKIRGPFEELYYYNTGQVNQQYDTYNLVVLQDVMTTLCEGAAQLPLQPVPSYPLMDPESLSLNKNLHPVTDYKRYHMFTVRTMSERDDVSGIGWVPMISASTVDSVRREMKIDRPTKDKQTQERTAQEAPAK